MEVTEKKQFPVSGFSGAWNLALGSGKRRVSEKKLRFADLHRRLTMGPSKLSYLFHDRTITVPSAPALMKA